MELLEYWAEYNAEFDRARAGIAGADLEQLLHWLEEIRLRGRRLFVLGNGGSAASASHWACDFGKGVNVDGNRRFAVLAPNEQLSWHTALANDVAYADAMAEQLRNWVGPGDLVVALSVSGDSENLVRGCALAQAAGARVVAIVGARRGRLGASADLAIVVPSGDYGVVEDLHMTINHAISQYLRRRFLQEHEAAQTAQAEDRALMAVAAEDPDDLLADLTPKEQEVVRLRLGLDDGVRRTLHEVTEHFGITAERVRQIEAKVRHRLAGS